MQLIATVAFGIGVGVVVYVLVAYPLLVALLIRIVRPRPPRRAHLEPTVTVILPVRNGARWIPQKLESILALDYPHNRLQVLVIDDGSVDATAASAAAFAGRGVEVVRLPAGGKAAALNAGLAKATGEVLFFTDVRQRLDPRALRRIVEHFADPAVGVVSGELIILAGETQEEADIGLYWRLEKWIRRNLSRLGSVPGATGAIYAMRRELATPLPTDMLVDDMFLPLSAYFKGGRIIFEGEARAYDYPTALDSEFRRKVRTLAGNYQIVRYLPRLLLPTHQLWLHFVSHKLGRLALPFALLAVAASTPWLPEPWRAGAVTGQALVYGLAAIDPLVPAGWLLKRASSPARTFVVLMAAALIAPTVLVLGGQGFWKRTDVREAPIAR
jgi:cellulose synthase/poly-beta-1,6-N-acetylglucosamine synthase-like glycosyltransferase